MENSSLSWLILALVILAQFAFLILSISVGFKIRKLFPSDNDSYSIESENSFSLIGIKNSSKNIQTIKNSLNDYLRNHYKKNKVPDLSQMVQMIKDRSRVYDGTANFFATVPILIGLGGTVLGLFFAFFNFRNANNNSTNFLAIISKSSSIAFIGTLSGIGCTIISNFFISLCKRFRDTQLNNFFFFLNSNLSPTLPTLKDETVAIIGESMSRFSEEYFEQFREYTETFRGINKELAELYESGLKETIERNTVSLEKLNTYIDKLDDLKDITRGITFTPLIVTEFSTAASDLVVKLDTVAKLLDSSISENKHTTEYLGKLLNAYERLEDQAHKDIVDLTADKQVFSNYGDAIKQFLITSRSRLEELAKNNERFDTEINQVVNDFIHSISKSREEYLNTVERVEQQLTNQVKKSFDTEAYKDFANKIESIQQSIENEMENIKLLASTLQSLNEKLSGTVIPAFSQASNAINNTNNFLRNELPVAINKTIEANKKMVVMTSEKLLGEPKSWGEWSYRAAKKLFRKNNHSRNDA